MQPQTRNRTAQQKAAIPVPNRRIGLLERRFGAYRSLERVFRSEASSLEWSDFRSASRLLRSEREEYTATVIQRLIEQGKRDSARMLLGQHNNPYMVICVAADLNYDVPEFLRLLDYNTAERIASQLPPSIQERYGITDESIKGARLDVRRKWKMPPTRKSVGWTYYYRIGCRWLDRIDKQPYDPRNRQLYKTGAQVLEGLENVGLYTRRYVSSAKDIGVCFLDYLLQKGDDNKVRALLSHMQDPQIGYMLVTACKLNCNVRRLAELSPCVPSGVFDKMPRDDLAEMIRGTTSDAVKRSAIITFAKAHSPKIDPTIEVDAIKPKLQEIRAALEGEGFEEPEVRQGLEECVSGAIKYKISGLATADREKVIRELERKEGKVRSSEATGETAEGDYIRGIDYVEYTYTVYERDVTVRELIGNISKWEKREESHKRLREFGACAVPHLFSFLTKKAIHPGTMSEITLPSYVLPPYVLGRSVRLLGEIRAEVNDPKTLAEIDHVLAEAETQNYPQDLAPESRTWERTRTFTERVN